MFYIFSLSIELSKCFRYLLRSFISSYLNFSSYFNIIAAVNYQFSFEGLFIPFMLKPSLHHGIDFFSYPSTSSLYLWKLNAIFISWINFSRNIFFFNPKEHKSGLLRLFYFWCCIKNLFSTFINWNFLCAPQTLYY